MCRFRLLRGIEFIFEVALRFLHWKMVCEVAISADQILLLGYHTAKEAFDEGGEGTGSGGGGGDNDMVQPNSYNCIWSQLVSWSFLQLRPRIALLKNVINPVTGIDQG